MKKHVMKLALSKETLRNLDRIDLAGVAAGAKPGPGGGGTLAASCDDTTCVTCPTNPQVCLA